jgi:hypothetical protein
MNIAEQELYLIAHAPQTIPAWFQPEIRKPPGRIAYPVNVFSEVKKYWDDENYAWLDKGQVSQERKVEIEEYMVKFQQNNQDNDAWYNELAIQRSVQWPIFWAKEVLKRYQQ